MRLYKKITGKYNTCCSFIQDYDKVSEEHRFYIKNKNTNFRIIDINTEQRIRDIKQNIGIVSGIIIGVLGFII